MTKINDPALAPGVDRLVRVTYRLFPQDPPATFVGTIVEERPTGRGPHPDRPGRRFRVKAKDAVGLNGWYSVREFEVLGWDADRLPAAEYLMLATLHFAALANDLTWVVCEQSFPAWLSRVARALQAKGLARHHGVVDGRVVVSITEAGNEALWAAAGTGVR